MARTPRLALILWTLLAAAAGAGDDEQVDWVGDWDEAFRLAKETGKPVMVCINSKDGESANERTARRTYRDPWFVSLSRHFVMIVVSTPKHAAKGACPRFGKVTCEQHLDCWKSLAAEHGERFYVPGTRGEMISPQHAWFAPDGKLLQRKEYELARAELLKRMRAVLAGLGRKVEASGPALAPLDEKDKAALERLKGGDGKARRAALARLLATGKVAAQAALTDMLAATKDPALKCDLLRALGRARVPTARDALERCLTDKEPLVRSFAAVAVEDLGAKESIPMLLKRLKAERDDAARKNLCRALGRCGGPSADKAAAKALLSAVSRDRQKLVRKHAALALREYAGAGAGLVRKRLEQAVLRAKDREVRQAIVFALVHVGDAKSTVRVLNKVLDDTRDKYTQEFVREAIGELQGKKGRFSGRWLFWEDRDDPARREEESK